MNSSEQGIHLGISTGSIFPGTLRDAWKLVVSGDHVTDHVLRNANDFAKTVELATPQELKGIVHPGISFHWSDRLDATKLINGLQGNAIEISTHDIPDLESFPALIGKIEKTLRERPKQFFGETKNNAGWYAMNTENEWTRMQRLSEAMKTTRGVDPYSKELPITIIRASIGMFTQVQDIDDFRRNLARYPQVMLALEIDAQNDTVSEYVEKIRQMNRNTRYGIPVYADIDLGHIEESRIRHTESETPEVNQFFEQLLSGPDANLVLTTSLNQYNNGTQTHVWLGDDQGIVDIKKTGNTLYSNQSRLAIPFQPTIVVETHPADSKRLFGTEGQAILHTFLSSFTSITE